MLFDREPIPLNLYLGVTFRFFQSSFSLMDLVVAAQLIFPAVCTDASLLSNCSAYVTEMLLCCSAFASLDQKSPVASSHFHSSISSISSTKESHNYSFKVRFNPASRIFGPHPNVACISRRAATTPVSVLPLQCAFLTCICFQEDKESTCCC